MSASCQHHTWSELAVRESDGLAVSLLWSRATGRVKVAVVDAHLDEQFEIHVRGRRRARRLPPPVRLRGGARRLLRRRRLAPRASSRTRKERGLMTIDPVQYARRWKTLGVLSLSLVIIGLDNTILNVALPTLQHEFDASASKLQWMVDSYLLVFAGLLLVFGMLGDRFGRKRALQAGISIFGLASLGALVADSADQVIAVRAAMGVGAALIMPATLSIIANLFTGKERGKAIAIWAALAAVGIGLGPLTGGLLLEWFDWSSVFMVNVPFAAAALLLGIRYVPESRDPRPGSFDLLGAALSTAGFSLLVYAIIEAPGAGLDVRSHRRAPRGVAWLCSAPSSGGSVASTSRCSTSASSAAPASASAPRQSASPSSPCSAGSSR